MPRCRLPKPAYPHPVRLVPLIAAVLLLSAGTAQAACQVKSYPGLAPKHLTNLKAQPKYNSFPPTSGPHYYLPAKWNIYTFPIPQLALVHNLEHGGVVVQYGKDVSKDAVAALRAWYLKDSNALVVAPLAKLGDRIALTAWNAPPYRNGVAQAKQDAGKGYLALCSGFDATAFGAFVKRHRYKAGERFPAALLKRNAA
jgi:hypothetical protein